MSTVLVILVNDFSSQIDMGYTTHQGKKSSGNLTASEIGLMISENPKIKIKILKV